MKKKIIIVTISIIISLSVLAGVTYALVFQTYTFNNVTKVDTGSLMLDMTYENKFTLNNVPLTDVDAINNIDLYTVTVKNTGNIPYRFNLRLLSTVSENVINLSFVKVQVIIDNKDLLCTTRDNDRYIPCVDNTPNELKRYPNLKELENTIISNKTLDSNSDINVSIRLWLDIKTPNTEIGKSFAGKLVLDAIGTYIEQNIVE